MNLPQTFGRYTLIEKIANGGTAEVYRAILTGDRGFTKTFAVKKLLPSWCENEELREMLIDEAKVLVHLQHQSIAQVFELGSEYGVSFLAMEFVEGIDCARLLKKVIRDDAPLSPAYALYIINQVLLALEFAHRCMDANGRPLEIVHRDISPSNILLSWNGEVKITDFGIAKGLHRTTLTKVGQLRGKYSYMAPEQARGEEVDARSDIFSCGIVLFELLTARRLFEAASDLEVLELVKNAHIPDEHLKRIPRILHTLVIPALSLDPNDRYQNAADMLADVRAKARTTDEMVTSIEMSKFLHENFPNEIERQRVDLPTHLHCCEKQTKVLEGQCRTDATIKTSWSPAPTLWHRIKTARLAAALVFIFASLTFTQVNNVERAEAIPLPEKQVRPPIIHKPRPPKIMGAIAINTIPTSASGTLILGEEERHITTPFAMDGLDIGEGIDGKIILDHKGYKKNIKSFRLTDNTPVFVKSIKLTKARKTKLFVQARPWGLVDISGHLSGRETPVRGITLSPGNHLVKVRHPPSGLIATKRISISEGTTKRCTVTFTDKASMTCR